MGCVHLIVSGKVQGVFFRENTRRKAIEIGLKGYAKNLNDGNVEVVAEGSEKKINELIDFIKNNPGYSKIENVKVSHKEYNNFKLFEVY
ncbi:MAG: acylphosphatase [Nanoarchaeota archaeon]